MSEHNIIDDNLSEIRDGTKVDDESEEAEAMNVLATMGDPVESSTAYTIPGGIPTNFYTKGQKYYVKFTRLIP